MTEKDELAKELQMIESTIRERENEITVNQLRMAAAAGGADNNGGGFAVDGVDYGLSGSPAGGKGSSAAAAAQFAEGIATAAVSIPKWEATEGHGCGGGGGGGDGALSRMRVGRG